ncbi:hypothetical protein WJX74_010469 [Apatococcus lobatus]|uniref:FAD-binding domain-containing protein n=2 Tax=Apatococcus TaxID=904362 RepID=A0AAW1TA54_9CHLO
MLDIAIVGGGPAGLFAALALSKSQKLKIKVFERASSLPGFVRGTGLDVNGMKAFRAVDENLFLRIEKEVVGLVAGATEFNQQGELLKDHSKASRQSEFDKIKEEYGVPAGMISCFRMQQIMFEALPEGIVQFDHALQGYTEGPEGVTLTFQNQAQAQGRCLIGADGSFSCVRSMLLHDGPPASTGTVTWRGRLPWRPDAGLPRGRECDQTYMGNRILAGLYGMPDDLVCWVLAAPVDLCEQQGVACDTHANAGSDSTQPAPCDAKPSGSSAHERCMKVAQRAALQMQNVVGLTSPGTTTEHGIYTRPAAELEKYTEAGWGRGRVTLLGNAAHPMRPTGQGLNVTLEDGVVLAWHLQQGGLNPSSLRAFEQERIPRVAQMMQQDQALGSIAFQDDMKAAMADLPMAPDNYVTFRNGWEPPKLPLAASNFGSSA